MKPHFPLHFSLESGTEVTVTQNGPGAYDFLLQPHHGERHGFTYVEGERTKEEWDESLEFEELDALRTFWLKTEEVV